MNRIKNKVHKAVRHKAAYILVNVSVVSVIAYLCVNAVYIKSEAVPPVVLAVMLLLLLDIICLILYGQLMEKEEIVKQQNLTREQQTMMFNVQNEETQETWNQLKKFRHDYTNHLICIGEHLRRKQTESALEYAESLLKSLKGEYGTKKISNSFVDTFLSYKMRKEKEENIRFKTDIVIPRELPFDEVDLCIILGNAFDNAVEAVKKIPETERYISISMNYKKHTLKIVMENSFNGEVKQDRKGRLLTTKKDYHNHGIGIDSMENTVSKYKGLLDISHVRDIFRLRVLLYEK